MGFGKLLTLILLQEVSTVGNISSNNMIIQTNPYAAQNQMDLMKLQETEFREMEAKRKAKAERKKMAKQDVGNKPKKTKEDKKLDRQRKDREIAEKLKSSQVDKEADWENKDRSDGVAIDGIGAEYQAATLEERPELKVTIPVLPTQDAICHPQPIVKVTPKWKPFKTWNKKSNNVIQVV